ncbi:MAG: hypothetical protein IPP77_02660 [Bacteroidetes bacterium]|nr:hypothetical protein [Bacteroidota bacterium]
MKVLPEYIKAGFPTDKKIKADYSKMARMCREALASHPEDKDYLLAWEVVYLCSDKQYEASLKAGREVLPVLTLQDCIDDIERNELWCLEQLGRTPEAIDILKKKAAATKEGNERYSVYGSIRELYKKLNDRENMLRYGSMMLEESPDQMDVEELREQAEL